MDQGGIRMIGLHGGQQRRPHTAPRLGDTPIQPLGVAGAKLLPTTPKTQQKVVVIGRDNVRELRCRSAIQTPPAIILSNTQLNAIKHAAQQVNESALLKRLEAAKEETKKAMEEKEERRRRHRHMEQTHRRRYRKEQIKNIPYMQEGDDMQRKSGMYSELENEEEVKELRKLVLAAKCHAIREAQILEKKHIRQLEAAEETRLAEMMEVERIKGLQKEAQRDKQRKQSQHLASKVLLQQIQQHQIQQKHLLIQKSKEARLAEGEAEKQRMEREEERRKQKERVERDKREAKKVMEEAEKRREQILKISKLNDMKILAETKKKSEQEEAKREKELAERKTKDELHKLWIKEQEKQIENDNTRLDRKKQRQYEQMEREWRMKELAEARARQIREARVAEERKRQVEERREIRMALALRKKKEDAKVEDHWMVPKHRELNERIQACKAKEDYELRIRGQIREGEERRLKEAEERRWLKEEEETKDKMRQNALITLKHDTIQQLRQMSLPEKLVQDLEKKLKLSKQSRRPTCKDANQRET